MVTAALVKELREKTGAGMMDCKKVLTETNGATTGTHLHLGIRINRKISKSIRIFLKSIKK